MRLWFYTRIIYKKATNKMRLSTKLFIGLFTVLTGTIVWQAIISNQYIKDFSRIKEITNPSEMQTVIKDLNFFTQIPCQAYSHLTLNYVLSVNVFKGNEFGIYVEKHFVENLKVENTGDTLIFENLLNNDMTGACFAIYIFVPADLAGMTINNNNFANITTKGIEIGEIKCKEFRNNYTIINTDISLLNIKQSGGILNVYSLNEQNEKKINRVSLSVHTRNGTFRYFDRDGRASSFDADIHIENSSFDFHSNEKTAMNNFKLTGTLGQPGSNYSSSFKDNTIESNSSCDSLIIHLNSNSPDAKGKLILKGIKGEYEDIGLFENIEIVRE
jgi:hypothetical protein